MIIQDDSIGYEYLGKLINEKGLIEYFRTGPNREPLYPFLIALSMKMGHAFSISYQTIQIFFQIFCLFLTQILTLKILRLLHINKIITALTILYMGFSPALINSTFCLYSEITAFPFMPAIVLCLYFSYKAIILPTDKKILYRTAVITGLTLLAATFNKGVFEIITPLLLAGMLLIILWEKRRLTKPILSFFIIAISLFYIPITAYKYLNLKYNGNFALTDRGAWALYGNTERRMIPLTRERFIGALASVGGQGTCRLFSNEAMCTEWSYVASDNYGAMKRQALEIQGLSPQAVNDQLIKLSLEKILSNPPQYVLLWIIEGLKMMIWECLEMAYVILSDSLMKVYNIVPLKMTIFFTMPILILISLIQTMCFLSSKVKSMPDALGNDDQTLILLFVIVLIFTYVGLYSFFFILARYAFPLASLYFILIAFTADRILSVLSKKKA